MQCCMLLTRGIYGIIFNKEGGVILSELKFIVYDVQHGSCSHVRLSEFKRMSFSYSNYVTGLAKNASLRDLFLCRVIILYTQFYI